MKRTITVIAGDGVGPEIMTAMKRVVAATGVPLTWEDCVAGAQAFHNGVETGVPPETIASIARHKIAIKGPLETPVGYGGRSANVTLRKTFETFGNIRPAKEIPGLVTPYSGRGIDLVVVRENVEDLYSGIEYYQTPTVAETTKLITEYGTEKICRLAFELALSEGRDTVHCATKANIMKFTEGLFKRVFERVSLDYPTIKAHHIIIDNCAHQLVVRPEQFQVIVTTNLNGDILSDLASGLVGGLGVAPSANIGNNVAIFESVHGSAPDIAGQNKVNPTAMMFTACMMLRYINEFKAAQTIEEALIYTLNDGRYLTADLARQRLALANHKTPPQVVGTQEFAATVIDNFGKRVTNYTYGTYKPLRVQKVLADPTPHPSWVPVGVDVFVTWPDVSQGGLASLVASIKACYAPTAEHFDLEKITCRGIQVWPATEGAEPDMVDYFRCRFKLRKTSPIFSSPEAPFDSSTFDHVFRQQVLDLLTCLNSTLKWIHIELLHDKDGQPGYN